MKIIIKIVAIFTMLISLYANQTVNIDSRVIKVSLKNHEANILSFPFIVSDAKLASSNPKDFVIKAKNDSIVIIPNASVSSVVANLIVWSSDGYTYLLKLNVKGKDQFWNFTSNRIHRVSPKSLRFETGRIDTDIKNLIKLAILNKNIPGYKKTKIKKIFGTHDLIMQKNYIYDGSMYRVEEWFLKNKTSYTLQLDEGNFYTKGILAIAFEDRQIPPYKIDKMWLVIDKASLNKGDK